MPTTELQAELASWSAYLDFVGSAAGTLIGLLFVAVSLRLNIFRDRQVADVRDFAGLTLISFLAVLITSGVALMPHLSRVWVMLPLVTLGGLGCIATFQLNRDWHALNARPPATPAPGPSVSVSLILGLLMALAFVGYIVAGVLVGLGMPMGFWLLALVNSVLLVLGTVIAWIMLSNAGASDAAGAG